MINTPSLKAFAVAMGLLALGLLLNMRCVADSPDASNHIPSAYAGKPETGVPLAIPGTIHAIDYDASPTGANGITFQYRDPQKKTEFRAGADSIGIAAFGKGHVSITGTPEAPDQVYLGWTERGEWVKYTVRVAEPGTYVISGKVAANSTGATLTFEFTPDLTTGEIEIPTTAGFQPGVEVSHVWEKLDHLAEITLPAGLYVMTIKIGKVASGLNLESFTFTKKP